MALSESKLEVLASDPTNSVLRWAEPGEARPDALSGTEVKREICELKQEIIDLYRKNPEANEFFLRYNLTKGSARWSDFASFYPTFWAKLTSSSCTRQDVITIHMMVDTRIALEEGKIADEKEVEAIIQNNLLALNFKDSAQARISQEMRQLREQARLRRRMLEKMYKDVVVPNEVLRRKPVRATTLDSIVEFYEKQSATPASKKAESAIPPAVMLLARRFLEVRAGVAEKCSGLPATLQSTGLNFMPTFSRSAQVEIAFGKPIDIFATGSG
jgi:hypothetical protein